VLYIPILNVLMQVITCRSDFPCWATWSLPLSIATTVVTVMYIAFALASAASFFDNNGIGGGAHGRVVMMHVSIKTLLVLAYNLLDQFEEQRWTLAIFTTVLFSGQVLAQLYLLPLYNRRWNVVLAIFYGIEAWASWCLINCMMLDDPTAAGPGKS
jgi:hypothetical protein